MDLPRLIHALSMSVEPPALVAEVSAVRGEVSLPCNRKVGGYGSVAEMESREAATIESWGVPRHCSGHWLQAWLLFNIFTDDAVSISKQQYNEIHR